MKRLLNFIDNDKSLLRPIQTTTTMAAGARDNLLSKPIFKLFRNLETIDHRQTQCDQIV